MSNPNQWTRKKKTFRAVIIDPAACTVMPVDSDGSYESTRALIGASGLDHFRIADHEDTWDYGWVDDTGLSRGDPVHAFLLRISKDPVAGRCILFGVDKKSGDTCDVKFPLDVLRDEITWLGLIKPEVVWDHTETASRAIITYERVKA